MKNKDLTNAAFACAFFLPFCVAGWLICSLFPPHLGSKPTENAICFATAHNCLARRLEILACALGDRILHLPCEESTRVGRPTLPLECSAIERSCAQVVVGLLHIARNNNGSRDIGLYQIRAKSKKGVKVTRGNVKLLLPDKWSPILNLVPARKHSHLQRVRSVFEVMCVIFQKKKRK